MENPGFQDSDQSMYDNTAGYRTMTSRPQMRRPNHLATLHPNSRNTVITQAASGYHSLSNGSNTLASHMLNHRGIPATAHIHGGRVVGVTGMHPDHITLGRSHISLANVVSSANSQPLYSCQAPRGHNHVYQCPGHRGDPNQFSECKEHHPHYTLDYRSSSMLENDIRCQNHLNNAIRRLEQDSSGAERVAVPTGPEQRTEYHYGGSDYSSTEPIYAQPQLQPLEDNNSPTRTSLTYTTMRGSLRQHHTNPVHHLPTPAQFFVRTDSTGASTSSSTLPTVSALMAMDPNKSKNKSSFSRKISLATNSNAGSKLKSEGFFTAWRSKYLEANNGSGKKGALLLGLLISLLVLIFGGLAAVLYLKLGNGAVSSEANQLIRLTERGSSVVTCEFRILNQNYWHGLADSESGSFKRVASDIENEINKLFLKSVWSKEFNRSEVVAFSSGSLIVRAKLHLNTPDTSAAQKFSSSFLRGLRTRHNQESWLGQYIVDITTIRFAEVLVDTTSQESSTPSPLSTTLTYKKIIVNNNRPNVGWGEWGPWSSCNPCSPQYDQIRTRTCHLDNGKGILVSNIELCSEQSHIRSEPGNLESRPCQCPPTSTENSKINMESIFDVDRSRDDPQTTTEGEYSEKISSTTDVKKLDKPKLSIYGICETCKPGEVCVAFGVDSLPICRKEKTRNDPTGCGGLCSAHTEVCQAVGPRAFECHSASQCLNDEWRCLDGLCIPLAKRCDGHFNCYDRSDENMCSCDFDQFHCGGSTSCIPLSAQCDGVVDCWDGHDEANCTNARTNSNDAIHKKSNAPNLINPFLKSRLNPSGDVIHDDFNAPGGNSNLDILKSGQNQGRIGPVVNRTAIGLSSLSNRERELLS